MTEAAKRPRGGLHQAPRRKVSDTTEAFEEQDAAARSAGLSWVAWDRLARATAVEMQRGDSIEAQWVPLELDGLPQEPGDYIVAVHPEEDGGLVDSPAIGHLYPDGCWDHPWAAVLCLNGVPIRVASTELLPLPQNATEAP